MPIRIALLIRKNTTRFYAGRARVVEATRAGPRDGRAQVARMRSSARSSATSTDLGMWEKISFGP
jgi:hypothetical protein